MTSILRQPSRPDLHPAPSARRQTGHGVTGTAAALILMVLVAAGIDAIVLDGALLRGIRDRAHPVMLASERA